MSEAQSDSPGEERTILEVAALVVRNARGLLIAAFVAVVLQGVYTLWVGPPYRASALLLPVQTGSQASQLAGLAAQFGVGVPLAGDGLSLDFYAQLVTTDAMLERLLQSEFLPPDVDEEEGAREPQPLVDILGVEGDSPREVRRNGIEILRGLIGAEVDYNAGTLEIGSTMPGPILAEETVDAMTSFLADFNLRHRQEQAAEEKEFLEARLAAAQEELTSAEGALEVFLSQNRSYESSPELRFEAARLQRRVDLRQQIVMSLAQSYEQARIEEVRNTPVMTVVDPAGGSAKRARRLMVRLVVTLFVVVIGGILFLFLKDYWTRASSWGTPGARELRSAVRDLVRLRRRSREGSG